MIATVSVASLHSLKGIHDLAPQNDEQWEYLTLAEGSPARGEAMRLRDNFSCCENARIDRD